MIPPNIDASSPPGERRLFGLLQSETACKHWIVLHSLGLARHPTQTEGEADFVIIVPNYGVAVVEVKSHHTVGRDSDGLWRLGNQRRKRKGPFEQANDEMRAIIEYARARNIDTRQSPFVYGVWFTEVRARALLPQSVEWHEWQLLDSEDLDRSASNAILRLLTLGRSHLKSRGVSFPEDTPSAEICGALAKSLRPNFEVVASPADLRRGRRRELVSLLEEQYAALDAMEENERCLFNGPAGSGKTLLAIEQARRESADGRSGRLVCFNRLLGSHLEKEFDGNAHVHAGTLSKLLLTITGLSIPNGADNEFWEVTLVDAGLERLIRDEGSLALDFLVVDEAQDLLREPYWDVLDLLVKGGMAGGRCLYFGDFVQQALYGSSDGRPELLRRASTTAQSRLSANCRNLPRIGTAAQALSSMHPGYTKFRRLDDGVQPTYLWSESDGEQQANLSSAVRTLQAEGLRLEDIVILSPRKYGAAAACQDPWLKPLLVQESTASPTPGRVRFSTIQGFKGLEAPAVIVTDIDQADFPGLQSVLYVGLTRPTDRLVVIGSRAVLATLF